VRSTNLTLQVHFAYSTACSHTIAALEADFCVKTKLYRFLDAILTMTWPYAGNLWSAAIKTIGTSGNVYFAMLADGTQS
jgi:hypothetical protein